MNIRRASLKNFKVIILIIGLLLTSEKAYECVKKYLYFNTGTKITLVNSNETLIPVLIICPNPSYKTTILNQIGITEMEIGLEIPYQLDRQFLDLLLMILQIWFNNFLSASNQEL